MQRTRRGLLGVGAAAVVGLSGCLGVEGVEYPDAAAEDPPNADGGDDGGGDGETAGDEQVDGDDPEPVANEALATATRNVVDDAVWFATEYRRRSRRIGTRSGRSSPRSTMCGTRSTRTTR